MAQFRERYQNVFSYTQSYDEAPSFDEVYGNYDAAFFESKALLAVYRWQGSGSYRYGIERVTIEHGEVTLFVRQLNNPMMITCDMAGWLLVTPVLKEDIQSCHVFDSVTLGPVKKNQ